MNLKERELSFHLRQGSTKHKAKLCRDHDLAPIIELVSAAEQLGIMDLHLSTELYFLDLAQVHENRREGASPNVVTFLKSEARNNMCPVLRLKKIIEGEVKDDKWAMEKSVVDEDVTYLGNCDGDVYVIGQHAVLYKW